MKNIIFVLSLLFSSCLMAQNNVGVREQFPLFEDCKSIAVTEQEACFYKQVRQHIKNNFKEDENLKQQGLKTEIIAVFSVDEKGVIAPLYIDASNKELQEETIRVFNSFPVITPAKYNDKPYFAKYTIKFSFPIVAQQEPLKTLNDSEAVKVVDEFKEMSYLEFDNPKFMSGLNIPFSHSYYAQFDDEMNRLGHNNHTASKPYSYKEVAQYFDFKSENEKLMIKADSWLAKKWWNEEMVTIKGKDYWFTVNPVVDLRLGKDTKSEIAYTYQNTRAIQAQGAIGRDLFFTTTIYESQGRFADYYNQYANSIRPSGGNPAIIPGIGIAKPFKTDSYDFPSADVNIAYSPNKFINLNFGYGRNFIGDGYRSILLGDVVSPHPFVKINTTFWKIKYTNTYAWLKDVRPEVTVDRTYATKFMANHYLSWNVNKRLNIGLFESVIWSNSNERGFDMNFANPLIFYRSVEFNASSRSGNAVIALTSKYKVSDQFNFYGQFLLDEFSLGDVKKQDNSWKNKYGIQFGSKYYHAFGINNLTLQAEYNSIRPYTFSHSEPITNYGHNNQGLAHLWSSNFRECIGIARYFKGRWFAEGKLIYGIRGFDFDTTNNAFNYGSNIYKDYDESRPSDYGVKTAQGNKTISIIADLQMGYVINPITNLKCFAQLTYRSFTPEVQTPTVFEQQTIWFSVGVRTDLFNLYNDF